MKKEGKLIQEVIEKLERFKILAKALMTENKPCFIEDDEHQYYFADIISSSDSKIIVKCFSPEKKAGKTFDIYWAKIIDFNSVRERNNV